MDFSNAVSGEIPDQSTTKSKKYLSDIGGGGVGVASDLCLSDLGSIPFHEEKVEINEKEPIRKKIINSAVWSSLKNKVLIRSRESLLRGEKAYFIIFLG